MKPDTALKSLLYYDFIIETKQIYLIIFTVSQTVLKCTFLFPVIMTLKKYLNYILKEYIFISWQWP